MKGGIVQEANLEMRYFVRKATYLPANKQGKAHLSKNITMLLFHAQVQRVVKGGSRSRFTENKTVLSQFTKITKITVIMKITVHG